jgi:hypothetical protein
VLIIADQRPVGIRGKGRLPRAGEPEEQRDIGRILLVDVGRAVHRKDARLGHVVVHGVEDRFLHFARVLGAEDDHDLA